MLSNLQALFEQANEDDIHEGKLAYNRYHHVLRSYAQHYGFGIVPTVEAFAAVSPNNDYHGNLRSMASVLHHARHNLPNETMVVSTYKAAAIRALSYVRGEVSFLETVKGKKITAFRHNLLYPESSNEVTVDGHMLAAWMGEDYTMKEANGVARIYYDSVANDIRLMAGLNSMRPHQMQAILWITRKRIKGIKYDTQMSFFHPQDDISRIICSPETHPHYPPRSADEAAVPE